MATAVSTFQDDTQTQEANPLIISSPTMTSHVHQMQTHDPHQQASSSQSTSHSNEAEDDAGKKRKTTKRRKVNHACLYCRRSHMTCDEGRPCQRCIKREIGHLCHDERRPKPSQKTIPAAATASNSVDLTRAYAPVTVYQSSQAPNTTTTWPISTQPQNTNYLYQHETLGNEFSVLSDFLETLDDGSFFTPPTTVVPSLMSSTSFSGTSPTVDTMNDTTDPLRATSTTTPSYPSVAPAEEASVANLDNSNPETSPSSTGPPSGAPASITDSAPPILPSATKTEKFFLTAADQEDGSRDERLNRVIRSKYEAGLLKPYNYVKGYARLSRWMDRNVSQESKQQILQPLSVLRPKFRAIAQSLRDIDLVFIEEAFERLLLDYDRVFSAMGVPACLWRRTGEIYKGNRQFSELVGIDGMMLRDGRLCIYELMAEESAVNYWEKYGNVAFDSTQKAVLTSCVLRYKPILTPGSISPASATARASDGQGQQQQVDVPTEEGFINCCFSFTIRRDKWGIPSMIVGNFIKC
ncbi:hypothetical protein AX15_002854 [Amanita polypyramis BW_CC]|nr:hypothetical protein AX15_002854 [Amanita polypyramis BW_CC]